MKFSQFIIVRRTETTFMDTRKQICRHWLRGEPFATPTTCLYIVSLKRNGYVQWYTEVAYVVGLTFKQGLFCKVSSTDKTALSWKGIYESKLFRQKETKSLGVVLTVFNFIIKGEVFSTVINRYMREQELRQKFSYFLIVSRREIIGRRRNSSKKFMKLSTRIDMVINNFAQRGLFKCLFNLSQTIFNLQ